METPPTNSFLSGLKEQIIELITEDHWYSIPAKSTVDKIFSILKDPCLLPKGKVYAFEYSHCVYEGNFSTISLHKTKIGAYNAMKKDKLKKHDEWIIRGRLLGKQSFKPNYFQDWRIVELEINE